MMRRAESRSPSCVIGKVDLDIADPLARLRDPTKVAHGTQPWVYAGISMLRKFNSPWPFDSFDSCASSASPEVRPESSKETSSWVKREIENRGRGLSPENLNRWGRRVRTVPPSRSSSRRASSASRASIWTTLEVAWLHDPTMVTHGIRICTWAGYRCCWNSICPDPGPLSLAAPYRRPLIAPIFKFEENRIQH